MHFGSAPVDPLLVASSGKRNLCAFCLHCKRHDDALWKRAQATIFIHEISWGTFQMPVAVANVGVRIDSLDRAHGHSTLWVIPASGRRSHTNHCCGSSTVIPNAWLAQAQFDCLFELELALSISERYVISRAKFIHHCQSAVGLLREWCHNYYIESGSVSQENNVCANRTPLSTDQ